LRSGEWPRVRQQTEKLPDPQEHQAQKASAVNHFSPVLLPEIFGIFPLCLLELSS
jgi:hypothetical protein